MSKPARLRLASAVLLAILALIAWLVVRSFDHTHSAIFFAKSPDGKYCVAVFTSRGILTQSGGYSVGLFEGQWPHRELPGTRAHWDHDSVASSDFHCTWRPDGVDMDFHDGMGDGHPTILGRDTSGKQVWTGP